MSKNIRIYFSLVIIIFLLLFSYFATNFRIDASSDTLVAQNDEDFKYFNYYQNIFDSQKYLVLAIKSKYTINKDLINEIENISNKIQDLENVDKIFNINKAPILFLNNASLNDLANQEIETIKNSKLDLNKILEELANSPIYKNQIINQNKNITSLIIFLKQNNEISNFKNKNKFTFADFKKRNDYINIKTKLDLERKQLIKNLRFIIQESNNNYEYYLGGIDMIADDVITFVKKDVLIFSISVILMILLVLLIIFREIKWVLICLSTSASAVLFMFGVLGLLNIEVTAVSSNFSSLMFILSISMNIHIINNYRQNEAHTKNKLKLTLFPI